MIETRRTETCPGCMGSGVQTKNDGLRVNCPICGGSGKRHRSNMEDLPPGVYCMVE